MSTAVRTPIPLSRRLLAGTAVTIALAAGAATVVALDGPDDAQRAASGVPTRDELLLSLSPEERRYVQWVMSATPAQLAATFGTGSVGDRPPLKPGANTR
jgi:hypothetical protein